MSENDRMSATFSTSSTLRRSRGRYAFAIVLVLLGGLLWRSHLIPLSPFLSKYGGDALWALLVFCGFGFLFATISPLRLAIVSLGFAWAIEFSQLYHAPWFDSIRALRIGHLVFGSTFNPPDLLAYLAGVAVGMFAELAYRKSEVRRHRSSCC